MKNQNFTELEQYARKTNRDLARLFSKKQKNFGRDLPLARMTNGIIKAFVLRGGKRIRPFLMYCGYVCAGGKDNSQILRASLSLELLHSFLLIHDDIVDRSDVRRGGPTIHKKIEKKYRGKLSIKEAEELGKSLAIWIGNICFLDFYRLMLESEFSDAQKQKAVSKINKSLESAVYGQLIDILAGAKAMRVTERDIDIIQELKTGKYTIEMPLEAGALLAGGGKRDIKILMSYSRPLGKAFQINDDILGLFGDPKKTGKPNDSDLKLGKKTLLIVKALQRANKSQKKTIIKCLGEKNISKGDVVKVKKIVVQTGSLDYSMKKIASLVERAKETIRKSHFANRGKDLLIKTADFIGKSSH